MTWERWVQLTKHWREQGDALGWLALPVVILVSLVVLAVLYWRERHPRAG